MWDGQDGVPSGAAANHEAATAETGGDTTARAERLPLPAFGRLPTMPKPYRPMIGGDQSVRAKRKEAPAPPKNARYIPGGHINRRGVDAYLNGVSRPPR